MLPKFKILKLKPERISLYEKNSWPLRLVYIKDLYQLPLVFPLDRPHKLSREREGLFEISNSLFHDVYELDNNYKIDMELFKILYG